MECSRIEPIMINEFVPVIFSYTEYITFLVFIKFSLYIFLIIILCIVVYLKPTCS